MMLFSIPGLLGLPDTILTDILQIVGGIAVVLWAANRLTEGSVGVATRLHVSQMVIGLTIVAMGTSMPEFFVSFVSALHQTPDLAVGNVVGSNIFNALLIVGCAAAVKPIAIQKITVRKDIPFGLMATAALCLLALNGDLSRLDAGILLILFAYFLFATLRGAKGEEDTSPTVKNMGVGAAILWIVIGLAGLILGSSVFVSSASHLAGSMGVSEAIIGLTIVAMGTSLPELATSIVAARRGNSGIAIGNVLGSNVFNILFILGTTGVISPMQIGGITPIDFGVMMASMVILWLMSFTKYTVSRTEGLLLILIFTAYLAYLIQAAIG